MAGLVGDIQACQAFQIRGIHLEVACASECVQGTRVAIPSG